MYLCAETICGNTVSKFEKFNLNDFVMLLRSPVIIALAEVLTELFLPKLYFLFLEILTEGTSLFILFLVKNYEEKKIYILLTSSKLPNLRIPIPGQYLQLNFCFDFFNDSENAF